MNEIVNKTILLGYNSKDKTDSKWLFLLQKKLEDRGFTVDFSPFSKPLSSSVDGWLNNLQNTYGVTDANTLIVRHDPGFLTLLRYFDYLNQNKKGETTLLVAGFEKNNKGQTKKYSNIGNHLFLQEKQNRDVISYEEKKAEVGQLHMDVKVIVLCRLPNNSLKNTEPEKIGCNSRSQIERPATKKTGLLGKLKAYFS